MIDPAHLRYFYAVATEGNFTKAAQRLHIGQPVVSQMVKSLEDRLGVRLFERQKRQALLTPAGQELFKSCDLIFKEIEAAERRIKPLDDLLKAPLRIGTIEVVTASLMSTLHEKFLSEFEHAEIRSISGPAHFLAEMVLKNQIDMAIVGYLFRPHPQLDVKTIKPIRHHVVVHRDVGRNPNAIKSVTFLSTRIAESDFVDAQPIFQVLKEKFPDVKSRIATNNLFVHKELVLMKKAVACLPEYLIRNELESGQFIDIFSEDNFAFPLRLIKRKSFELGPLESWFLKSLKQILD